MVGCSCGVCTSDDPRNRRFRPSIWLRYNERSVVIDVAPEFRLQALENGIESVDAVLFTHAHADHCLGLDDLRIIIDRNRHQIPVYASEDTLIRLHQTFGYLFASQMWGSKEMRFKSIPLQGAFQLFDQTFEPLDVLHNRELVTGFRFGSTAYITDVSKVPEETKQGLVDLDLLIISALRYKPHPKHFGLRDVLVFIAAVAPKRTLLTHMSHEMEYEKLKADLPEGVEPAYDGLTVEVC